MKQSLPWVYCPKMADPDGNSGTSPEPIALAYAPATRGRCVTAVALAAEIARQRTANPGDNR